MTNRQKDSIIRNYSKLVLCKLRYISYGLILRANDNRESFTDEERKLLNDIREIILLLDKDWHSSTIKLGFNRRRRIKHDNNNDTDNGIV